MSKSAMHVAKVCGKVALKIFAYILNTVLTILLIGIIAGIIAGSAFLWYVNNYIDTEIDVDIFDSVENVDTVTKIYYTEYTDRDNRIGYDVELVDQRIYGETNSIYVKYNDMPQNLVSAFVAIEDERFWTNKGVDWKRTIAAVGNFFLQFDDNFGGSSITQQLIKNVTGEDDYTIQRKVQEIFWALDLEKKKSKQEILELYLNAIYFSQNCWGVQSAAYTYFGKDVDELTLLESACLAAIPNSPTKYDPIINPDKNKERRNIVLDLMYKNNMITDSEYNENYNKDIELNIQRTSETVNINSWYTDMTIDDVINDLVAEYGYTRQYASKLVYSGGLQIYTVMDPEVQAVLEEVYASNDAFPQSTSGVPAQSSMIVIHPTTGDVLGVVGGKGNKTGNRIQNYATHTLRSPGSSIKPLSVYAPALEAGLITYGSIIDDFPVKVLNNGPWPSNLPVVYNGLTTVNSALERSVNTVAVRVLNKLTPLSSYNFCKNVLKMDSLIAQTETASGNTYSDIGEASLALGQLTYGLTVREITAAYSIFANDGIYNDVRTYTKVLDNKGKVLLSRELPVGTIAISEENAYIMTKMLQNVVNNGTGRSITLRQKIDVAGKTGTAGNDYDRWFIGFTPYYIGGVWYGYEYNKAINAPGYPANDIWDAVMTKLHQKYIDEAAAGGEAIKTFEQPANVVKVTYCKDSGMLMGDACALDPRGNRADVGYFAKGTEPTETCTTHVIVNYDTSTGGVAHDACPSASVKQVALIKVEDRHFPLSVYVTDAQYVYRELPEDVEPGSTWNEPFFINTVPAGQNVGTTNLWGGRQYNSFCYEHFDFEGFREWLENKDRIPEDDPEDDFDPDGPEHWFFD